MPPVTPRRTRRAMAAALRLVRVLDLALCGLLEGHGQVVLRARLDEGRKLVEGAFTELVVVVVDLPGTLRGVDHQRVARVHVVEQLIDSGMDHGRLMVPAVASSRRTISSSLLTARWRSSLSTT